MRALVYRGHKQVAVEEVPDAHLPGPDGALVRTTRFAICGSDLHGYRRPTDEERVGNPMGHECIGEVVEVGPEVRRFGPGDRVLVSAVVGCGKCPSCQSLITARCLEEGARVLGGPGLDAAQAEAIGVHAADSSMLRIPEWMSDEQAVLLTDILPTGYKGSRGAEIQPGDTVAVVGLGPVGQMALETAFLFGPSRVFAIDQVGYRLEEAERLGAIPVDASQVDPTESVLEQTEGRGVDKVVEAAGPQATVPDRVRRASPRRRAVAGWRQHGAGDGDGHDGNVRQGPDLPRGVGLAAAGLAVVGAPDPRGQAAPGTDLHAPGADVGRARRV